MAVDFPTFKALYPELVSCGDGNQVAVQACIDESVAILGSPPCIKLAEGMILAMSAHCVAKSGANPEGMDDSPGAINSASVGSVSVSYQFGNSSAKSGDLNDYYNSTQYGRRFLVLQRYCRGGSAMVAP